MTVPARKLVVWGLLAATLFVAACATEVAGEESERIRFPLTDARSAELRFEKSDGEFLLSGGGVDLLEGEALGANAEDGSRESTAGVVATGLVTDGDEASAPWDLQLGGGLPTDIVASLGSVEASIDLSVVDAKNVAVDSSGTVSLSLAGPHPSLSSFAATSAGPSVYALTGEYPALEQCAIAAVSGDLDVDLAGPWHKNALVRVTALRPAHVVVTLPKSVNLNVVSKADTASVSAEGLTPAADGWTYTAEKPVPYTLGVRLVAPAGSKVELLLK